MRPKLFAVIMLLAALAATAAQAEVTRRDAIEAQTATALASADYAERHCPSLRLGQDKLDRNLREIKGTLAGLRATESYAEQVAALASIEQSHGRAMVCVVLPKAHGGYGRGIVTVR
ncbi:hypothetical protein [Bosea sp. (in: a-proteobacteria)]|uniref:UrcA family protein n=1 Tax=Bosea vestrisii TaxID=151416 RepID=A0ABW0H8H4_9HYPH|nr:hypothetical protein [Bosea sp. (in: a-proteobacteria)]MBA4220859.1 hypothetical protein [Methylobacterium sp.]MBR3191995.1 hypothetical protein [Bosea sp. (in: a-proteobacteria)]